MNDIDKSKIIELSSNDYKSDCKTESMNLNWGTVLPLIIPIVLIFSSGKGKPTYSKSTDLQKIPVQSTSSMEKNDHDIIQKSEQMVDKLSNAIDLVKKVNKLNDIKKVSTNSQNSLDSMQEAFSIIRNVFSDTGKIEKLDTLENTLSTVKKFNEVKKVLDLQKTFSASKNDEASIDHMVEAISPLLSSENNDNLKNIQKIVKMANLISTLNNTTK